MSESSIPVYASIVNWNNYHHTLQCIASLKQINYPSLHIIVVDNGSQNNSVTRIRTAFSDIPVIVNSDNLGFAGGQRVALEYVMARTTASGLFWILNNDTVVSDQTLIPIINSYYKYGDRYLYGSVPLNMEKPDTIDGLNYHDVDENGKLLKTGVNIIEADYKSFFVDNHPIRVSHLHGSSMFVPIPVINAHGFMDESFFLYGEEVDYCHRLRKLGVISLLVPSSTLRHVHRGSYKGDAHLQKIQVYYKRRGVLVFQRRHFNSDYRTHIRQNLLKCIWILAFSFYYKLRQPILYYQCLATRDAIFNNMGKTLNPEDFLLDT